MWSWFKKQILCYDKASKEFDDKYGRFGEKLQTEKEKERKLKRGEQTVHFMSEVPEYKEISDKYFEESHRIDEYRETLINSNIFG